jgi:hypothetical protein
MLAGLTLPELSDPDPEVAGEGSLDPLGLAALADRLADELVPDVRARMSRIRFLTAVTVGAVVTEDLLDVPPGDGESLPSVCFEWLVLESFVRRQRQTHALDGTGIPGSSKASAVIAKQQRLTAANYLKTPRVFGFFGVYQPLARGLRLVDELRLPGERWPELTEAWEAASELEGFTDGTPRTPGGRFRRQLRDAAYEALVNGRCSIPESSPLFFTIASSLKPAGARPGERRLLRDRLLSSETPMRAEVGHLVDGMEFETEHQALRAIRSRASAELVARIDGVLLFERFAYLLDAVFRELCRVSTLQGSRPVQPNDTSGNEVIDGAATQLADAFARAAEALAPLDLAVPLEDQLGQFGERMTPAELTVAVMTHHERHQLLKPPRGKRPWFEEYGGGWVVRQPYRDGSTTTFTPNDVFIHPFRIETMCQFLEDLYV